METFRPAELEAFIRFGEAGMAPRIVSCELATTCLGDVGADLSDVESRRMNRSETYDGVEKIW